MEIIAYGGRVGGVIRNKLITDKMATRLPYTPNSRIRSALRQLWLKSRERASALKRDEYTCVKCGRKQSVAKGKEFKVEVHHKHGVLNWDELINAIRKYLLCDKEKLETLCKECHREEKIE